MHQDVPVVYDSDQNSTDLMKCIAALQEKETTEGIQVRPLSSLS